MPVIEAAARRVGAAVDQETGVVRAGERGSGIESQRRLQERPGIGRKDELQLGRDIGAMHAGLTLTTSLLRRLMNMPIAQVHSDLEKLCA